MKTNEIRFKTFNHLKVNHREIKDEEVLKGFELMDENLGPAERITTNEELNLNSKKIGNWNLDQNDLVFSKDSKVEFGKTFKGSKRAHKLKMRLEEGADVKCYFFYDMDDFEMVSDIDIEIADHAKLVFAPIISNGSKVYMNIKGHLAGEGAQMYMEAACIAGKNSDVDINLDIVHNNKFTKSELNMNGVLLDNAKKSYKYSIDFPRGSAYSKGVESETVIALTENFKNTTVPILLVGEDMIEAEHGATLTELDKNILDYIASRGIGEAMAKFMVIEAQLSNAVDLFSSDIKKEILSKVEKTFLGDEI